MKIQSGTGGNQPRLSGMGNLSRPEVAPLPPRPQADKPGNPIDALRDLEQWRAQAEDTDKPARRWPLELMPLQVYIEPNPELPGVERQLLQAARQWEAVSNGLIRFAECGPLAQNRAQAHIRIVWANETVLGRDYEVGHTDCTVQGQRITQALITLIKHPIIDGHLTPERQQQRLYATMLHEMGHALGLEHSQEVTEVMYYRGWQRPYLTANDAKRLLKLYPPSGQLF